MIYSALNNGDPLREITEAVDIPEAKTLLLNYFDIEDVDPSHEEKLSQKLIEMLEWKTTQIEEVLKTLEINFGIVIMLSQMLDEKYWTAQHTMRVKIRHKALVKNGGEASCFLHADIPPYEIKCRTLTEEEKKNIPQTAVVGGMTNMTIWNNPVMYAPVIPLTIIRDRLDDTTSWTDPTDAIPDAILVDSEITMLMNYFDLEDGCEDQLIEQLTNLQNTLTLNPNVIKRELEMLKLTDKDIDAIKTYLINKFKGV